MRVFIVDDQRSIRTLLMHTLGDEFEKQEFSNAVDAFNAAIKSPPDVILSDLKMPEMSGIDLIVALKKVNNTKDIPVILLTAHQDVSKLTQALEVGAFDYLIKPCEPLELRVRLRAAYQFKMAQYDLQATLKKLNSAYRLIKKETEDIGRLQRLLLPGDSYIENDRYRVISHYEPSMDSGGDFFDIVPIDENRTVFAVGDVSGHGAKSTVIMAVLKSLFTEYVYDISDPAELLSVLNEKLIRCLPVENFITFFICTIDWKSMTLVYSSAGHENPIYYNAMSSEITELESDSGYPLYMDKIADYSKHVIQVSKGDSILFFTDGVYDVMNRAKGRLGYEAFMQIVSDNIATKQPSLMSEISTQIESFRAGEAAADDITYFTLDIK
ncbi:MAG: fused response regulator/phosphatase [Candidatus Cloacimonetes bacterium]|nr:fused response regulator/phosphatase [Candidatus Cloacimonadota bacterium]